MARIPSWHLVRNYINKNFGKTFTRKDMHMEIGRGGVYIDILYHAYILKKVKKGVYKAKYKIPQDMNTDELLKLRNQISWKKWFMPLKERRKEISYE